MSTIDICTSNFGCRSYTPAEAGCSASGTNCRADASAFGGVAYWGDGEYGIGVTVTDVNGVSSATAQLPVIWDLHASTAVLYSPSAGATLSGVVTLSASGNLQSSYYGDYVDFYIDGVRLNQGDTSATNNLYSFDWDTRKWENGQHLISVGGFDGNHDQPGTPISVVVHNPIPTRTTVSASATRLTTATYVNFSATVSQVRDGARLAGQSVTFTGRTESGSTIYLGTGTTDDLGQATVGYMLRQPTQVSATTAANGDFLSSTGKALVRGIQTARLTASRLTVPRGQGFTLYARTSPSRTKRVNIYYKYPGMSWYSWTYRYTNSQGLMTKAVYGGDPGYLFLRVSLPATSWRYGVTSNWVRVHLL